MKEVDFLKILREGKWTMELKYLAHGYTSLKKVEEVNIPLAQLVKKLEDKGNWKPKNLISSSPSSPLIPSLVRYATTNFSSEEEDQIRLYYCFDI